MPEMDYQAFLETQRGSPSTANTLSYEDFLRLERGEEIDTTRTWANTARQVGQGLSFGTADEIEAGVTSLLGDETYDDAVGRVRETNEAYQRKNPMRAMALQALGAAPTVFVPGAALGGAARVAQLAKAGGAAAKLKKGADFMRVGKEFDKGASLGTFFKEGVKHGAVGGGLHGAGSAEGGAGNRALGALAGATVGGALGGPLNTVIGGASSALKTLPRAIEGADDGMARRVASALNEDGIDARTVVADVAPTRGGHNAAPREQVDVMVRGCVPARTRRSRVRRDTPNAAATSA